MSQNNANNKSFANMLNIWILQHNCARSTQIMHACMKFAKNKTDIVILQESWMRDENITISHSSFICIKSNVQNKKVEQKYNWQQRSIEAYDISNRLKSYRAQSYDQNKSSFNSIASQMTVLQVKNRKLKIFTFTQVKIDDETRVHQRRRKNHQFRQ